MEERLYENVLFEDLRNYLAKKDYLSGYTTTEQSWIRKNLGIHEVFEHIETNQEELKDLINQLQLIPGTLYTIDYLELYKIILMAYSNSELSPNVIMISDDKKSIIWDVKFDVKNNKVIYLKDENNNEANFDFKHIKINVWNKQVYMFLDEEGNENSKNCKGNNLCYANNISFIGSANYNIIKGNNVLFESPINNCLGTLNNVKVNLSNLDLADDLIKQFIIINNKIYLDYLDLQTLTHQLYEL